MISLWAFFLERWDIRSEDSDHNGCLSQSWLCLWWCEKNKLGQNKTYILLQLITLYWPMLKLDRKEDWAPKNWWFWIVCWRRLLRVPWAARRSNQLIVKEINPEYSLEGLMMKLKFQYFGHLTRSVNSLEKTLMLRKTEDRRRGQQGMR